MKNSRNYIMNGKLELFMVKFDLQEYLETLFEFYEIKDDNKFLKSINFSLFLQSEDKDR